MSIRIHPLNGMKLHTGYFHAPVGRDCRGFGLLYYHGDEPAFATWTTFN